MVFPGAAWEDYERVSAGAIGCPWVRKGIGVKRGDGVKLSPAGKAVASLLLTAFMVLSLPRPFPGDLPAGAQPVSPPRVALTFDDGYNYDHRIFDYLTSQGIRATCFLIGSWMERNPSSVKEMADRGWEICNHTYHHAPLTKVPDDRIRWEVSACQDVIRRITGQDLPLMRPPGGFIDDRVRAVISSMGFTPVMWSLDSMDARSPAPPLPERISFMVNHSRDGSIILFHLGGRGTLEMVTGVVEGLKRRGFVFVTVGELYGIRSMIRGGDIGTGVPSPAGNWYFAEGTARKGFECWFSIFNPSPEEAKVLVEFFASRGKVSREYRVASGQRITLNANSEVGLDCDFSCLVSSATPVVAERSLYFQRNGGMNGATVGTGSPVLSPRWIFPLGQMGVKLEDYLFIFNPGQEDTRVQLELYGPGGLSGEKELSVPPEGRASLDLSGSFQGPAATVVLSASRPLAAERACYFDTGGGSGGGFLVPGFTEKMEEWYFPEGTTRFNTRNYLHLFNPNSTADLVEVTLISGEDRVGEMVTLDPWSVVTLDISRYFPGEERDFSLRLRALLPLVTSRTVFFNDGNALGGSTDPGTTPFNPRSFYAEGCTANGYCQWLVLFNSLERASHVEVVYFLPNREEHRKYEVGPFSRVTVNVGEEVGAEHEVSIAVNGEAGVCSERALYFSRPAF